MHYVVLGCFIALHALGMHVEERNSDKRLQQHLTYYVQEECDREKLSSMPIGLVPELGDIVLDYKSKYKTATTLFGAMYEHEDNKWHCVRNGEYHTLEEFFKAVYTYNFSDHIHQPLEEDDEDYIDRDGSVTGLPNVRCHVERQRFSVYAYNKAKNIVAYPMHEKREWSRFRLDIIRDKSDKEYLPANLIIERTGSILASLNMNSLNNDGEERKEFEIVKLALNPDGTQCACGMNVEPRNADGSIAHQEANFLAIITNFCNDAPSNLHALPVRIQSFDITPRANCLPDLMKLKYHNNTYVNCITSSLSPSSGTSIGVMKKWSVSSEHGAIGYPCAVDIDDNAVISPQSLSFLPTLYKQMQHKGFVVRVADKRIVALRMAFEQFPAEIRQMIMHKMIALDPHLQKNCSLVYGSQLTLEEKSALTTLLKLNAIIKERSDDTVSQVGQLLNQKSEKHQQLAARYCDKWSERFLFTFTDHLFKQVKGPPFAAIKIYNPSDKKVMGELVVEPTDRIVFNCKVLHAGQRIPHCAYLLNPLSERYCDPENRCEQWCTKEHMQTFVRDNGFNAHMVKEDGSRIWFFLNNGTQFQAVKSDTGCWMKAEEKDENDIVFLTKYYFKSQFDPRSQEEIEQELDALL